MSLSRNFFGDLDPIFRLVQDTPSNYYSSPAHKSNSQQRQAHVEVTEEGNEYCVRAELPGVSKENLDVHVGNDGRSLTIEGHVHRTNKTSGAQSPQGQAQSGQAQAQGASDDQQQSKTYEYRSTFSRTVWLPHAVDGTKANAKLTDGVLTLSIPKRNESGRQKISLM